MGAVPPLSLGILAALTPRDWQIKIVDETFEDFVPEKADLVGVTSLTCNAPRAYEIADQCRKANIKTVMGGVHASLLPEEALRFF
jgi:radical SAM superfamily enzyme YgiQ (UPF0313 family)